MAFNPALPADDSVVDSIVMRSQLTALNADTQTRATPADVTNAIASAFAGTSNNSNSVGFLSQSANSEYNQSQMQDVLSKIDELITALRR